MAKKKKQGSITVPNKNLVHPHEIVAATVLSWTGYDVEFLPTGEIHSADIIYRGKIWEIKSPIGNKRRTIENNLRAALNQSVNVIIDLSRIKMDETKAIREITKQVKLARRLKSAIIITKNQKIIEL